MAAVAAPTAATAQSRGEIRRDRQEVQEERRELEEARRRGDRNDIREEREDLRDARQELREDRQDRRDRRRTQYVAPYRDWRYSTVRPGYQLRPSFYSQRYVITNPSQYRLRAGARNQQWIRYGDDLLLVNVRNGRVLQVIRNRYW
jgi:Ni/Co efflux regulator RcnB